MMHYMFLFNRQRKIRLHKWFDSILDDSAKQKKMDTLVAEIMQRTPTMCNFLEHEGLIVAYKRYASLYFVCGFDESDNELIYLDLIHKFVEILDQYFGNVCELDIVFNCDKAYYLLDEYLLTGEVQESSVAEVVKAVRAQDLKQERESKKSLFHSVLAMP